MDDRKIRGEAGKKKGRKGEREKGRKGDRRVVESETSPTIFGPFPYPGGMSAISRWLRSDSDATTGSEVRRAFRPRRGCSPTPTGLCPQDGTNDWIAEKWPTPGMGHNAVGVEDLVDTVSQGSRCAAIPGLGDITPLA